MARCPLLPQHQEEEERFSERVARFRNDLCNLTRPRSHPDVVQWFQQLTARDPVEWRMEVETLSPCSHDTITKGIFLHHLLKLLVRYGEPSLRKNQFVHCFREHFLLLGNVPSLLDVHRAHARDLLMMTWQAHIIMPLRRPWCSNMG